MVFIACGLNHKTAPIDVREQLAVSDDVRQHDLLQRLTTHPGILEAAVLSTCNRTEIYCESETPDIVIPWLAECHQLSPAHLNQYTYCHQADDGIRHAMRVACGLDSMMLGEPQIFGQMKHAFLQAEKLGTIGAQLRPIFHHIFSASKRIRTHTALGVSPVSIAYASVHLIKRLFKELHPLRVLLIGSGETAQLVATYLQQLGISQFFVASRTLAHAERLGKTLNGKGLTIADIPEYIANADIIVSATACPLPFINKSLIERAMAKRKQKALFLLDLAMPRDIEHDVGELSDVFLYNIDDLQGLVEEGINQREDAAVQAEQIINYELDDYIRWHRSLRAKDAICLYRHAMDTHAKAEVLRALKLHQSGASIEDTLEHLSYRLVNKLSHKPSVALRKAAADGRDDLLELAHYLYE